MGRTASILPAIAGLKEVEVRFVVAYSRHDFAFALRMLAAGASSARRHLPRSSLLLNAGTGEGGAMSKLRWTTGLAERLVPVTLCTLAAICELTLAPVRTVAQNACELDGRTELVTDVPQATVEASFVAAGKTFAGVGDSATVLVTVEDGHQIFLTIVVLAETSPGFFTLRETLSVGGCIAAPALSYCGLIIALGVLLAVAGNRLRRQFV